MFDVRLVSRPACGIYSAVAPPTYVTHSPTRGSHVSRAVPPKNNCISLWKVKDPPTPAHHALYSLNSIQIKISPLCILKCHCAYTGLNAGKSNQFVGNHKTQEEKSNDLKILPELLKKHCFDDVFVHWRRCLFWIFPPMMSLFYA